MKRYLSYFIAVAIAVAGCTTDDTSSADDSTTISIDPAAETPELDPPRQLVAASWPDDLASVDFHAHENTIVIVALNHDDEVIARIALDESTPGLYHLETEFVDGKAWATIDQNGALMQRGTEGLSESELTIRAHQIGGLLQAPEFDPDQEGPWLECALAILDAVITCIPAVGVLPLCPYKLKKAVCTCATAAQKKKKKVCADD
ncbi:MAG TPA: hypothetical protein VM869_35880 [Enhygromyxa sp.]|nr:hypothetical protein [Enhygromyxa sp.]